MKKRKIYLFEKLFEEKINDAICKWTLIGMAIYAVVRTTIHFIK